jgi:hypothetical protein
LRVLVSSVDRINAQPVFAVSELNPLALTRELRTLEPRQLSHEAYSMASSNDGRAVITTGFRNGPVKLYSQLRQEIEEFRPSLTTFDGVVAASGDGSSLLVGSWHGAGVQPVMRYDSNASQLVNTPLVLSVTSIAMNRSGNRVIFNHAQVYDDSLALMGALPDTTLAAALSPATMRAYTYDSAGSMRTFDVSAALPGGEFAEVLPAISLTDGPGDNGPYKMLVTYDERAVFLAGTERALLIALP